jgi:Flp pilus assembly protein CpaB
MQTPDTAAPAAHSGPAGGPRRPASRSRLSFGHVVTLLAGLLATVLVFSVLRERDVTFRAAAAGVQIRAGTTVEASALRTVGVQVPGDVRGRLIDPAALGRFRGWIATRTLQPGELLSRGDLRPPAAPSALRAMSIPVEASHAVGGALAAGDRLDVIEVDEGGQARYVVTGAEVLAVNRPDSGVIGAAASSSSLTVAVDARQALRLAAAIRGGRFELVRSTGADAHASGGASTSGGTVAGSSDGGSGAATAPGDGGATDGGGAGAGGGGP